MSIILTAFKTEDIGQAIAIWNQVVREGIAFPQTEELTPVNGLGFFQEQSFTGVARDGETGEIVALYILHPNNIGRCGHICNASYAVREDQRGKRVGEALVTHCMTTAWELGFRILQFNAVVRSNAPALRLYQKLGFTQLGVIPGGFRKNDGSFEDIIPHYIVLNHEMFKESDRKK
ncbi:MAG: GNAT family N-acetyltransferase [Christensenella sp.]|nr:GNAT family N-acetyltransferase [Christensenella sp.]